STDPLSLTEIPATSVSESINGFQSLAGVTQSGTNYPVSYQFVSYIHTVPLQAENAKSPLAELSYAQISTFSKQQPLKQQIFPQIIKLRQLLIPNTVDIKFHSKILNIINWPILLAQSLGFSNYYSGVTEAIRDGFYFIGLVINILSFILYMQSDLQGKKFIASSYVILVKIIFLEFRFNAIVSSAPKFEKYKMNGLIFYLQITISSLNKVVFPEPTAPTMQ
ncbi:MAG: hypothetical protein EZS28_039558, partial [Streblomastix strix]